MSSERVDPKAPMLIPFVSFLCGLCAGYFNLQDWIILSVAVLGLISFVIITLLSRKSPLTGFRLAPYFQVCIAALFFAIGGFDWILSRPDELPENKVSHAVWIQGEIENIQNKTTYDNAKIKVNSIVYDDGVLYPISSTLLLRADMIDARVGDIVEATGKLKPIDDNSGNVSSGYISYLASKGIHYQFVSNSNQIAITGHRTSISSVGFDIRLRMEEIIDKCNLNRKTRDFLTTVLLGDREYLDRDLRESFANAGISHILALSGMHVGIIAGMLMIVLFPLNLFGKYRIRILLTVIILIFYALITGFQPSTVRSVLMAVCMLTALWFERKNTAWNSLLISAFLILLISPRAITDIGLQLSFFSVASLIFFSRQLNPISQHKHEQLYKVASFIITTLTATICIWVLSAYFFGIVPLAFLAANILILPFLPLYLFAAVLYLLMAVGGISIDWLGVMLDKVLDFWHTSIDWLTADGNAVIQYSPPLEIVIAWLTIIAALAVWINRPSPSRTI